MADRRTELEWLRELTSLPTAAGREQRVVAWIQRWARSRRRRLELSADAAGNLFIEPRRPAGARTGRRRVPPLLVTAHLDHPAFVCIASPSRGRLGELADLAAAFGEAIPAKAAALRGAFAVFEFRGGVNRPYFDDAELEIVDRRDRSTRGRIVAVAEEASPHRRVVVRLRGAGSAPIVPGDLGRWHLPTPRVRDGLLFTHACDDLAAVAAALAMLDRTSLDPSLGHVGVLLTRAEEIGFIGAIAAARGRSIPKGARLICLENSRSFAESPVGGGPIVRVGDRLSVFTPELTNRVAAIAASLSAERPEFRHQRRLMPGGACEATAFAAYGHASTCLCLALGHYHNMSRIDEVAAGERPARVAAEFISVEDYHGLVELLVAIAERLDRPEGEGIRERLERLFAERSAVLSEGRRPR